MQPANREELRLVVAHVNQWGIPDYYRCKRQYPGSDEGIRGVVVKVGSGLDRISLQEHMIVAESGARLSRVAAAARDAGLGGFEFSSGIPGNIGGVVVMNAGLKWGIHSGAAEKDFVIKPGWAFFYKNKG
ncbi:MAG: FAD-binding protein [Candidatus Syntrophopropionicum ammoniitolerans]